MYECSVPRDCKAIFYHNVKKTVSNICATNSGLTFGGRSSPREGDGLAGERKGETVSNGESNAPAACYEQSRAWSFDKHGRKCGGVPEEARERAPHVPVEVRRAAEGIDEGDRRHAEQQEHRRLAQRARS